MEERAEVTSMGVGQPYQQGEVDRGEIEEPIKRLKVGMAPDITVLTVCK